MSKRRKAMPRRNAKGRFVKAASNPRRRTSPRRYTAQRRTYKRNAYFANAPRRASQRRYRRNPPLFGGNRILGMSIQELLYAGGGFVAPPLIEGALSNVLPDALKTSQVGKYVVKGGIVAGLAMVGGKFLGREAGKYLAIGGATYLVANLIVDFAPQIFSGFSGTMLPAPIARPNTLRGQIGLGAYLGNGMSQQGIPDRLSADSRF